jgi:RND family efflux transporter MFP subunit
VVSIEFIKKNKRLSAASGILIWLLLVFIIRGYEHYQLKKKALEDSILPVSIVSPLQDNTTERMELPGNIMAWNQSYIYSRVDGYIKKWLTDYGAVVHKGQLMAEIKTPTLLAEYGSAKANMKSQEAMYDLAMLTANRYRAMKASRAVSIQEISVKEALLKAEKAKYDSAKYKVKTLAAWLKFKKITAPFDGVVISRNINLGDYVSKQGNVTEQSETSSKHLFIVADVHKLRLFVSIPERFSRFLVPGFTADVVFPQYPNRKFKATFLTSAKAFDPETRTVVTEFVMDNKNQDVWPGSYATVSISARIKEGILSLPTTAMIFDAQGTKVATIDENNIVHFKKINVEKLKSKIVQIGKGLSVNDKVINNPNLGLIEGSKVKVVNLKTTS